MRTVGTNHGGYANDRNIADLPFHAYRVVRCSNAYRLPNYIYFKLRRKMHPSWPFLHWDGGLVNYDLLHFFNGISLGRKPWLSTFETYLPRWAAYGAGRVEWGLSKLADTPCKRLIALSACTRDIQRQFLADHPPWEAAIMAKVEVLHPPQAPLIEAEQMEQKAAARRQSGRIKMVLVGTDFFRKGGLETLHALDVLLTKGAPLQLDIASSMQFGDYASKTTQADLTAAMRIIHRHPNAIFHHRSLPNAQVLQLFRNADIGLLPTWADTYGYTALEAMAAGCAVVSTDVRALPEVNDVQTGWVLPVEKDSWGNAILKTEADRARFSTHLEAQLIATFETIAADPDGITAKGLAAHKRILERHSPAIAAKTLEGWYDAALR